MSFLETVLGLCLLITLAMLTQRLNVIIADGLVSQERKLIKITQQYLNRWNITP